MPYFAQKRTPTLFSGRLRHKIDLVQVSPTQDSTGGLNLSSNSVFANVWATVEAITGEENFAAGEFVSSATHQVVIRWMSGVNSAMQVWFAGRQFQIKNVLNPDGRNKMLLLVCEEINDSKQQITSQPGGLT